MAFTLDQNVQGAGAFTNPIKPTSSAGIELGGAFLRGLDSFGRAEIAREKAEAVAARASLGTQTDRDRQAFSSLLNSAKHELASGKNPDDVSVKYASEFASLNPNDSQKAVLAQTFGNDIFAVAVQPTSVEDTVTNLWQSQTEVTQLALINLEVQRAKQNGEPIDPETALDKAKVNLATASAQARTSLEAGNIEWGRGFDGNMQTLDRLGEAVSAILSVEASGGNFSLEELARLRAGYDMLRTQRAFMQPSGTLNTELWEQMKTKMESIDRLFSSLEDYDAKAATAEAKQFLAAAVTNLKSKHPLAVLAVTNPDMISSVAAKITGDITGDLSKNGNLLNNVVSYKDLNFDPSIVQLMGFDVEEGAPTTLISKPDVFPTALEESHAGTLEKPELLTKAITTLGDLTKSLAEDPNLLLSTPEGVEAWASHVSNMSYLLSEVPNPSSTNLDILFSRKSFDILGRLESAGGDFSEQAAILRQQMGYALNTSSVKYVKAVLGEVQNSEIVAFDSETKRVALDVNASESARGIQSIVDVYYGGNFDLLAKEGASAYTRLRNKIISREDRSVLNDADAATRAAFTYLADYESATVQRLVRQFEADGSVGETDYERFLLATRFINPDSKYSEAWLKVSNLPTDIPTLNQRLGDFRRYEKNLNLDTGFQSIIDSASSAIDAAFFESGGVKTSPLEPVPMVDSTGPEQPEEPPLVTGSGTRSDPYTPSMGDTLTDEAYQSIPENSFYRDDEGSLVRKGPTVDDTGPEEMNMIESVEFDPTLGVYTPKSMEEYNEIPVGSRWIDSSGNVQTK